MKKIAIEEHFYTEGYITYLQSRKDCPRLEISENENRCKTERICWEPPHLSMYHPNKLSSRLLDLGEERLKEMDEAGIDMQVLSLSTPGVELFDASDGTHVAKIANDELSKVVRRYPERFSGFAAIAPQDPEAAANELERAVKELGLKGALINSHIRGDYLDEQKYWVIFERAEKLGVPIYIHPKYPPQDMLRPYLAYPELASAMWGFAADAGLHAMCLICSGVFDKYPGLKIILGHLGEALPFWLWRIDNHWLKGKEAKHNPSTLAKKFKKNPSQYIKDNFYVTTSGMFWQPALLCVYLALGADNILFAVDYPYESSKEAVTFIESTPISDDDKGKICHLNAERLLAL